MMSIAIGRAAPSATPRINRLSLQSIVRLEDLLTKGNLLQGLLGFGRTYLKRVLVAKP